MTVLRLAIVDDSTFVRKALVRVLEGEAGIKVVGLASSGEELLEHLDAWRPDIITLDLLMPGMGGLETLDRIMAHRPTPVIILSTHSAKNAPLTIEALHRGAIDFIDKQQYSLMDFNALRTVLVEKFSNLAPGKLATPTVPVTVPRPPRAKPPRAVKREEYVFEAAVVGASTGGPPAIQAILEALGDRLTVPMAVVQHMPAGFTKAFADRLNARLPFQVREAEHGEPFTAGTVFIAPSGQHMKICREGEGLVTVLSRHPDGVAHRPSVDVLFASAAAVTGGKTVGVLLTGMGKDGAQGMLDLFSLGACTIAEDQSSCAVYGMPRAAVELGGVEEILPLEEIGPRLCALLQRSR